jgi:hypothetical protein
VVEGSSLENCRAGNRTEGSNPSLSAIMAFTLVLVSVSWLIPCLITLD